MENIITTIIRVVVVLICITVHEFFHGYSAYKLGDDTAKRAGRLSLNPIKHIDPIGTIMFFIFKFGWAKPVPVNPYNFNNMKTDMALTAVAGPISNFILAIISALILKGAFYFGIDNFLIMNFLYSMILFNIGFGLFNLLPFPPLDGSKIIGGFMPDDMYFRWMSFEQKGAYLLMAILLISFIFKIPLISMIILPPLEFFFELLVKMAVN